MMRKSGRICAGLKDRFDMVRVDCSYRGNSILTRMQIRLGNTDVV